MTAHRKPYDTDISDAEWAFVAPYLTLLPADAGPHRHDHREVLNALRCMTRAGSPWRLIHHDLPPWHAVYDQARRWLAAGCSEAIVHDLRKILRLLDGRSAQPRAAIIDSRTIQSNPRAAPGQATMAASGVMGRRSTWPSTPWGTCWRCTSRRLRSRTGRRWMCSASGCRS